MAYSCVGKFQLSVLHAATEFPWLPKNRCLYLTKLLVSWDDRVSLTFSDLLKYFVVPWETGLDNFEKSVGIVWNVTLPLVSDIVVGS